MKIRNSVGTRLAMEEYERLYRDNVAALHQELKIPGNYNERGLSFHIVPRQLILGECDPHGKPLLMAPRTAHRWLEMKAAAGNDGISLVLESAYRSLDQQAQIIRDALAKGEVLSSVLTWVAAPGYSEHHSGRALDIGSPDCFPIPNTDEFETTAAFAWLQRNASRFEFVMSYPRGNPQGIIFEPWHWCLRGEV